jgi:hypothetical protein
MAKTLMKNAISPEDCLKQLKQLELDLPAEDEKTGFRSAELRNSVLLIAELDHVSETTIIQKAVKNALGKLPSVE